MQTASGSYVIGFSLRYMMRYSIQMFYLLVLECSSVDKRQ